MRVEVTFICPEIVGPLRSGLYDVPENTTVSELLEISSSESGNPVPQNVEGSILYLLNGKSALPGAKLAAGDEVFVLRKVFGG